MPDPDRIRNRLLAVIATVLVVAALKWSYPVTMPIAAAVFVMAAAWPVKLWLDRVLPSGLSYAVTLLLLLVVLAGFFVAVYLSLAQVVQAFAERRDQFARLYEAAAGWAQARGLALPGGGGGFERLAGLAQAVLGRAYTVLAYLGVIAVLVLLGLPEVPAFRARLRQALDAQERSELLATIGEIAERFRSYVGVTLLASLITGAACAAWAWVVGLDLALTWGVLNFLLNFVPVFGNIIGVVPPTLYALIQFQGWTMPAVVFLGYAALQLAISNVVYPWMQGRGMALSPVAVIVALSFWGWLWGVAGALLAVPLTAAVVIVCGHFPSTAWIARLLSQR